ncbi:ribosome silencing factor [Paenibacillus sp.]|uniref:ribosome silencing factor n=1 Tax=Paenibacillus sp. TaxID=58172 RepID=UPI002D6C3C5D|nr:ribosome silencing factor [Paenibacillus sp.]HZG84122.1 ribosome silencing factor [Paenibacillus sp.]
MTVSPDALLQIAVEAAEDKKAQNIVALDLKGISPVADYYVICHGNSDTQVQSITTEIRKKAEESGVRVRGVEGFDTARWVLLDIGDVVVHVFHREEREYYNIERLWSDAKSVELA